ncbi:hypothetical protein VCHA53O466_40067 [Vibrio chagasii]|nr:hypothetical protein VCHA53O466_40067 [Vibrio chagasii]
MHKLFISIGDYAARREKLHGNPSSSRVKCSDTGMLLMRSVVFIYLAVFLVS